MSTKARFISIAALLAGAGLSLGCARGPDIEATGLGLKRVVIYRNGVGYFEREGRVDADQVSFKVRNEKVGDFLATLAVIEKGGSSVRSASFPVAVDKHEDEDEDEDDAQDPRFQVLLKPPPPKKKEKKDKLETVKLTLDGKEHDLVVGYVAETPVWRPSYRLVISQATAGAKAATTADLQAWGIVQNLSGEDWKGVTLSLVAGAPLAFQSTLEKAVIPERPIVTDQGEVIASVPTGETSLNSEVPAASPPADAPMVKGATEGQRYTLDELVDQEKEEAKKDYDGDGWGGAPGRAANRGPRASGGGKAAPKKAADAKPSSSTSSMRSMSPRPVALPPAPAPPPPPRNPSPPRDVRALAAVAMEAGTTHYDLPFPVDVPNNSATMVLLLARPVPGESIFLFAPDGGVPGSTSHPFRVVRFTNDGKGLLERGPIAVFENGAFLGQGMVDPLPPGATATVPFALERSLAVESNSASNEEGARVAAIEGGRLEINRDWVTHTKYTVKNGGDADAKALIKHARQWGTRLNNAPKGTEDNTGTGSALVPLSVGKHASAVLDVDERKETRRQIDWLDPLADDAVKAYLADPRADQAVVAQLRQAWEARGKLRTSLDERDKLSNERGQLDAQIDQINSSLRAIEKNRLADELRKTLTDRLAKASTRIDEITKRVIVLDMQVSEQSIRFRDLVSPIRMVKPLPVP